MTANHDISAPVVSPVTEESIWDNARWPEQRGVISIAVPTFRDDPTPLIEALGSCEGIKQVELVIYDDGSGDEALLHKVRDVAAISSCPTRIVAAATNCGRAVARNRLISHARSDWILLLDADMLPDSTDFLTNYMTIAETAKPGLVVGGFSLKSASTDDSFALHRWQAEASECVPAQIRSQEPGRFVFTSNVMAHRQILNEVPFDEGFSGWGWEDVDWGLRTAKNSPVRHIDNTATHLGLDTDEALITKYGRSGPNFVRALEKHPDALDSTPLAKASRRLAGLPQPFRKTLKSLAAYLMKAPVPVGLRGRGLKLWRAAVYAEAIVAQ